MKGSEAARGRVLLGLSVAIGVLVGWVDSRPSWDDAGITAAALLLAAALLGAAGPERPWLWALGLGIWVPLFGIAGAGNFGSLLALPFAFAGAYAGSAARRAMTPARG